MNKGEPQLHAWGPYEVKPNEAGKLKPFKYWAGPSRVLLNVFC